MSMSPLSLTRLGVQNIDECLADKRAVDPSKISSDEARELCDVLCQRSTTILPWWHHVARALAHGICMGIGVNAMTFGLPIGSLRCFFLVVSLVPFSEGGGGY